MLDENEFLSPYGIRALSRYHKDHPYSLEIAGMVHSVSYEPGDSTTGSVRGKLQLARTDLDAGELPAYASAAPILPVLWRLDAGGVSDRVGSS